jgi:hypothetical protein
MDDGDDVLSVSGYQFREGTSVHLYVTCRNVAKRKRSALEARPVSGEFPIKLICGECRGKRIGRHEQSLSRKKA